MRIRLGGRPDEGPIERLYINTTAVFERPFVVPGLEEVLPAGEYRLEAEVGTPSDLESWKALVLVHLHPTPGSPALARTLTLPLEELDRAVARDKLSGRPLADFVLEQMLADPMVRLFMASDGINDDDMRRAHSRLAAEPGREPE
jgi:hypothetical protein